MVTLKPLAWSNLANDAAMIPLPNDEVTPPVTNIYLVIKKGTAENVVQKLPEVIQSYRITD
jgi:hypothetical protein